MNPIDTYRYAFQQLLAQGKSPLEALREFDREKWYAAMNEEIELGGTMLLDLSAIAGREECDETAMEQATELWLAGWTSELPKSYNTPEAREAAKVDVWRRCAVMSWYWRRPPRRKNSKGQFYWSTNQAWMAMTRESEPTRRAAGTVLKP